MTISATSQGLRPGVCTSSNRPANPFDGMMIYETDTDKTLVYHSSAWYAPWNLAWGTVFHTNSTAGTAFSAATPLSVLSGSVSIVAGRRYRVYGRVGVQVTGTAAASNALYVNETTLGNKILNYETAAITQYYCKYYEGSLVVPASDFGVTSGSSSKTITLYWRCAASGGLNTNPDAIVGTNSLPHQLTVEDIGPA